LPMMVLHLVSRNGAAGGFVQAPIDDKRAGVAAPGHLAAPVRVEMQTPIVDKRAGVAAPGHLAAPVRVEMQTPIATGL
jgi:hypothetical protein